MKIIVLTLAMLFNFFFQETLPSETSNQIIQTSKDAKNIDLANKINTNVNSLENFLLDIGYKEVNKALQESENYFNRDIALPTQLPPVTFTHNFGRFTHSFGKENDQFEITYINENDWWIRESQIQLQKKY